MIKEREEKLRGLLRFQKDKKFEFELEKGQEVIDKDGIYLKITESELDNCLLGKLEIKLENDYFKDNYSLETYDPIQLFIPVKEVPKRITSLYLFTEWWTRPAFSNSLKDIPERTQFALFKFKDHFGCFIPMVGESFKAYMDQGTETEIGLKLTAYLGGIREVKEPLYIYSEDSNLNEAINKAFSALANYKNINLREDRRFPELFNYLGWCSWDAFYTDVDEKAIRDKVKELKEKDVPIRWMIIDDGWMTTNGQYLKDFLPDKNKFPDGFRDLVKDTKSDSSIDWIGVWHALGGYWNGIDKESALARDEKNYLYETVNGKLVPSPISGEHFYKDWYKLLRNEGIDFVKVDAQSSIPTYFENSIPVAKAARGLNEALEEGAIYFDNTIINCMGMAMENVLARPTSTVSRNSNDFFPNDKESFKEHLLENAYNGLYHNQIYNSDWDMFWTDHKDNVKHSLLRAISGGPIYVSDKVGKTVPEILRPLSYSDGKILLMERSALPTEDSVFIDPFKEGVLKLHNVSNYANHLGGGIAAFNLTDKSQDLTFAPSDIPDIEDSKNYWVYDYFNKKAFDLEKEESFKTILDKDEFSWFIVLPDLGSTTPIGLIDKYNSFIAVENLTKDNDIDTFILTETGPFGWISNEIPKTVTVNSVDVTEKIKRDDNLNIVEIDEGPEKMVVSVTY